MGLKSKKNIFVHSLKAYLILFILFVLGISGCSQSGYVTLNNTLLVQGKQQEVIADYEKRIKESPDNSDLYYQVAGIYFQLNQHDKAGKLIQKALLLEPQISSYRLLAGKIFYSKGEYFEAINYLTSALVLDDRLLEGYYKLAQSYVKVGKSTKAIQQLEIAIALEPLYFDALLTKISIQLKQKKGGNQLNVLIAQTEQVLKIKPASVEGRLLLSSMYFQSGNFFRAKFILEDWIKQFEHNDKILFALAQLNYRSGKNQEALDLIQGVKKPDLDTRLLSLKLENEKTSTGEMVKKVNEMIRLHPDFLPALLFSGELEMGRGDVITAERLFQKATRKAPNSAQAHFGLSKVWEKQNDVAGRYWALEKAKDLAPENVEIQLEFLQLLLEKGEIQKADAGLGQLMVDPDDRRILVYKGLIAKEKEDYFKAEEFFRKAQKKKYSSEIEAQIVTLEALRGQFDPARIRLDQILSRFPNDFDALLAKAKLYFYSKEYKALLPLLERHIAQGSGNVEVPLLLGESLIQLGETEQAIEVFKTGLQNWPHDPELAQSYTLYLGLVGKEREAIQVLEEMRDIEHKYSPVFKDRLAIYYFRTGEKEKFLELRHQQNIKQ